ncbi:MAG TPA: hypothetical protein VJN50_02680 [Actinomycetota bacterium]|nr:hypothetical protein [Actinomycetota bacterium]
MRRRGIVASGLASALVAGLLAGSPAGVAGTRTRAVSGRSFQVEYRGTRLPLLRLAATSDRQGRETMDDVRAEAPFLGREKHGVSSPAEPTELFPVEGWDIPTADSIPVTGRTKGLVRSWEGSNHFQNRYSNGGNQFSLEPPDQGLCAGNGYVMETVNDVVQVYDTTGTPLIEGNPAFADAGSVGLAMNEFYGYPPSFDRTLFKFGPFLFDPACLFDPASNRWFHLIADLRQNRATGAFTGAGSVDLAVSRTGNPLRGWRVYRINTVNDGTGGTPDHDCAGGPCFADFPHLGIDQDGVYITTNEYSFFADGYTGAQLYALSKADLVAGSNTPTAVYFESLQVPELGQPSFTVRATIGRPGAFSGAKGGTQYFLSSTAGDGYETGNTTGGSDQMVVWALTNSSSLGGDSPDPKLRHVVVETLPYVFPPLALQRDEGPLPLLDCINQGVDCVGDPAPFVQEGPYPLDGSDTRVLSAFVQDGVLWGTLGTAIDGPGGSDYRAETNFAPEPIDQKVGVFYFAIRPQWHDGLDGSVVQQGYVAVDDANLIYPSIAFANDDVGFIGVTLVGPDMHPSAAYMKVGPGFEPSKVRVAAEGVGPDDGFTGTFEGDFRPRWGDYGYAVPGAGGTVWLASEYIAQRCDSDTFLADPTCGYTRSFFANWSTRVTQLQP